MQKFKSVVLLLYGLLGFTVIQASDLVPYKNSSGSWSLFDRSSKTLQPEEYDEVLLSKSSTMVLRKSNQWLAIDRNGNVVIPLGYLRLKQMENGWIQAIRENDLILFFPNGKKVVEESLHWVSVLKNDPFIFVVGSTSGKVAILKDDGSFSVPFIYDFAPIHLNDDFYKIRVLKNKVPHFGVTDKNFKEVIPPLYHELGRLSYNHFYARNMDGTNFIFDKEGKLILTTKKQHLPDHILKNFYHYNVLDDLEYYATKNTGDSLFSYDFSIVLDEEGVLVASSNKSDIMFFSNGKQLEFKKINISRLSDKDYLKIRIKDDRSGKINPKSAGLIDLNGKKILDQDYYDIVNANKNYAIVVSLTEDKNKKRIQKQGIVNLKTKKVVVPINYDRIQLVGDDYYALWEKSGYIIYDNKGKRINDSSYADIRRNDQLLQQFPIGKYSVVTRYQLKTPQQAARTYYGIIDHQGKEVLATIYHSIGMLRNNHNHYTGNNIRYLISIYDPDYPNEAKTALMNSDFKILTKFEYHNITGYNKNEISIHCFKNVDSKRVMRSGLMDLNGKIILAPEYDRIEVSNEHGFIVRMDNNIGFINRYGKIIVPMEFSMMHFSKDKNLFVIKDRKYGLYSVKGDLILSPIYESISDAFYEDELFLVKKDNIIFYTDSDGKEYKE